MTSLSHQNWVPIVSALMCIITHWMSECIDVYSYTLDETYGESGLHQAIIPYDISTLREYLAHNKVCSDFNL